jgi:Flp pilus assembly protein CpaB
VSDLVIVSVIAAIAPVLAVLMARRNQKKERDEDKADTDKSLREIHVLVNSRLTEALEEIRDLCEYIDHRLPPGETSADAVPKSTQ